MNDVTTDLISMYIEITQSSPINTLGKPFTYYYADDRDVKTDIISSHLFEIDIKSAFPTICKIMFGHEHPFVQNIYALDDKLERNIYIATTLKQQSQIDGHTYLNDLNLYCKILILNYVYSKYEDISVIEYVKDGILIRGVRKPKVTPMQKRFLEFVQSYNIEFHENIIPTYMRFNKTSIYVKSKEKIKVKGRFHDPPEFIIDSLKKLLSGNIYDFKLLNKMKKVYTNLFFEILKQSSLLDDLKYYYEFGDGKYVNKTGTLSTLSDIYPKGYLVEFIYPILSLLRLNRKII